MIKDPNIGNNISSSISNEAFIAYSKLRTPDTLKHQSLFISLEGVDGSGKSTQKDLLKDYFEKEGLKVYVYREPGGTPFGELVRNIILTGEKPHLLATTLLFLSSRAELLAKEVLPKLQTPNTIVLLDRYLDSTLAYQGVAENFGIEKILLLHQNYPLSIIPHLTIYYDIDLETSLKRRRLRGEKGKDRFESEDETFFKKVLLGYRACLELSRERMHSVPAAGDLSPLEILDYSIDVLKKRFSTILK